MNINGTFVCSNTSGPFQAPDLFSFVCGISGSEGRPQYVVSPSTRYSSTFVLYVQHYVRIFLCFISIFLNNSDNSFLSHISVYLPFYSPGTKKPAPGIPEQAFWRKTYFQIPRATIAAEPMRKRIHAAAVALLRMASFVLPLFFAR